MARELPFKDLEEAIHSHKRILQQIMTDQYMLAKASKIDPGSEYVQQQIYNKFCEAVTDKDLDIFGNKFQIAIIQRDKILRTYAANSIDHLKGIRGNEGLLEAQFIEGMAKDIKTGAESTKIVPVTGYYTERNIADMIRDRHEDFLPEFLRPNGEKAPLKEIEVLSVSNITGLYDHRNLNIKTNLIETLEYGVYLRLKNSEREMRKLLDWFAGLRNDYPYDALAERIVFRNDKRKCGNTGEQMYEFMNYTLKEYVKYGNIILKNVNTRKQNAESTIKKLNSEGYDANNFREVLTQMKKIYSALEKKSKGNQIAEPNNEQRNGLLQYISMMHFFNDDRIELQLMNAEMESHFKGKYIGHTSRYLSRRDSEREEYLMDPSKSPARRKERKREERTVKNKNRQNTKSYHLELLTDDSYIENDSSIKEPSIRFFMQLMEERYRKVIMRPEY